MDTEELNPESLLIDLELELKATVRQIDTLIRCKRQVRKIFTEEFTLSDFSLTSLCEMYDEDIRSELSRRRKLRRNIFLHCLKYGIDTFFTY